MTTDVAVPFKVMNQETRRVVYLEEISDFITKGTTPTTYGFEWVHEGVPFLRSECVSEDGFTTSGLCYISEEAHQSFSRSIVHGDDLLITITGNVGRIAKYPTTLPEGNINQHIARVRITDVDSADSDYVLYTLKSRDYRRYFESIVTGLAYPQLSLKQIRNTPVSLPPLPEQKKIAEVLSSVDEAIAATKAVIDQTKQVKKGLLQTLLTKGIGHTNFKQTELGEIPESWEVLSLEKLLNKLIDYRGKPPPKASSGVPLITAKNVRQGYLNEEPREYIAYEDFDNWMVRGVPEAGDILFTTEAPLGFVAEVPDYQIALGQRTVTLCPNPEIITRKFLKWMLLSPKAQTLIHSYATGSTAKGIKQKTLRTLEFAVPPVEEQNLISKQIDAAEQAIASLYKEIEVLQGLKHGLMSDLLTGRKRVETRDD